MALQASAISGNTDTATLGLGANMGYYDGTNGYEITMNYQYSKNGGTVDEDSLLYDLEYTRDFGAAYYGFAKLQGTVESIPFDTTDNFLGFGVGVTKSMTRVTSSGPYKVASATASQT